MNITAKRLVAGLFLALALISAALPAAATAATTAEKPVLEQPQPKQG